MGRVFKRYGICFITLILCPAVIFYLYYEGGYYPFGGKSVAYLDMYQQYVPLLYNLRAVLGDFSALWYNPSMGGGMGFFGVFCYYLNPDSFLSLFFPKDKLAFFPNILLPIKISLAALSAAVCLKYYFKNLHGMFAAALGAMYGFGGYTMQVYQIIGWMSGLILFPLVLIAMARLIDKRKYGMFVALIVAAFFTNFYIALFILGYGLFISFFYIRFLAEDKKGAAATLLVSALSAALISCAVLVPCYFSIKSSVRESGIFHNVLYGNPHQGNFLFGPLYTKLAYIVTLGISIPALCVFLFNYKKTTKSRFLLFTFLISVTPALIEPVNVIWHLGSYAGFPLRLGFIPCFASLLPAAAWLEGEGERKKGALFFVPVLLAVAFICGLYLFGMKEYRDITSYSSYMLEMDKRAFFALLILSALCGAAYLLPALCSKMKLLNINLAAVLMLAIALAEAGGNFRMFVTSKQSSDAEFVARTELKEELRELEDGSFYRIKDYTQFDRHNTPSIAFNSFNHYTSLTNANAAAGLQNLGYTKSWFWICSAGGTAFSDSLLSHRLVVNDEALSGTYLSYLDKKGKFYVYENPYSLNMGIISKSAPPAPDGDNPFDLQESLYEYFTGEKLFNYYDYSLENLEYSGGWLTKKGPGAYVLFSADVGEDEILYLDIRAYQFYAMDVYVNGERVYYSFPQSELNGLLELGTFSNETVDVKVVVKETVYPKGLRLAGLPLSKLSALGALDTADEFEYGGGTYRISADSADGGTLFLSVPYDVGFSCTVNGKKAEIHNIAGFIGVKLEKGENQIALTYRVRGFAPALAPSLAGAALLILFALYNKGRLKLDRGKTDNLLYKTYLALVLLGAAVMFIFPAAVFIVRMFI